MRTIGGAIGISTATTLLTRNTQTLWNQLGGHISVFNPALWAYLHRLGLPLQDPHVAAVLGQQLGTQAEIVALLDVFKLIAWSFLLMLPLMMLVRGSRTRGAQQDAADAGVAAALE